MRLSVPNRLGAFDRETAVSAIAKLVSLLEANDGDAEDAVQAVPLLSRVMSIRPAGSAP